MRIIYAMFMIAFSHSSYASSYLCEISYGLELNDNGKFQPITGMFKEYIGKEFVVDRRTGEIVSKTLSNSHAQKIEVLSHGDDENSFKVISYHGPKRKIDYLIVNEHINSSKKSFQYLHAFGYIYSGVCKGV